MTRVLRKTVAVGGVLIGGEHPISVQSMTNTDTRNVQETLSQIARLRSAGCEIVRVAVPDADAAASLGEIVKGAQLPVVADIHFDHRLALTALRAGVAKLRLNPGNIGGRLKVREVVLAAKDRGVPIRIGVNAGSLERELLSSQGGPTADAMVESAMRHVRILEGEGFDDIVVSLKASSVLLTVAAFRMASSLLPYPLHLGVTEAGTAFTAAIRSGLGLGILLNEGIGDTIRVSITGDPVSEVRAGYELLGSLGLRRRGARLISCPTCGRCRIDLVGLVEMVQREIEDIEAPITVAVMGCAVNGPGEAREADLGIAGGHGEGLLFRKGAVVRKVSEADLPAAFRDELSLVLAEIRGDGIPS